MLIFSLFFWFADSNRSSRVGGQFVDCNEPSGSQFFGHEKASGSQFVGHKKGSGSQLLGRHTKASGSHICVCVPMWLFSFQCMCAIWLLLAFA